MEDFPLLVVGDNICESLVFVPNACIKHHSNNKTIIVEN